MAIHSTASGTNRWFGNGAALDNPFDGGGTWLCWAFHDVESSGDQQNIVAKAASNWRFQQHASGNNRIQFQHGFSTTGGIWFTPFPADIPQGVWNHLVVRYNADVVANDPRFSLNGADAGLDEAVAPVGTRTADTGAINVGGSGSNPGRHFQEDLRIYSRELSDAEILTIATVRGPDGIVDGLIARWMQDEGSEGVQVPTTADFIKDRGPFGINGKNAATNPTYEAGNIRTRRRVA